MKCCMYYQSMGIIKIYFGKSQENLKKTFLAGLLNYNRKGYPKQTILKDGLGQKSRDCNNPVAVF